MSPLHTQKLEQTHSVCLLIGPSAEIRTQGLLNPHSKRDTKLRHTWLSLPLKVSHPDGSYRIPQLPEECKAFFNFFDFIFWGGFFRKSGPFFLSTGVNCALIGVS